ncbi:Pyruvate/Phosphoenolpyruvate kinase-like domain-containing protein [Fimicolochytrium jonesii]|uniref:Pyruvate/Phosphoenolpyruvate kinase-like domain-containing protein n=1 Tax=Fimicolochytrium jonesii TaxID=1396493 RepID=UPI0022FF2C50|nr:Pyruvate/Phosphoenolpyruvate kinase-like domain-containing protein [Fimicolochytrium jonesii]KAI8823749.1 Pyruvate/Phosphoenolpyruvate kinase-like domain-containing protein [Fimicolochytrium jonesii]
MPRLPSALPRLIPPPRLLTAIAHLQHHHPSSHLPRTSSHFQQQQRNVARALSTAAPAKPATEAPVGRTERARRAVFYVPGSDDRKLAKSRKLVADSLIYDLEDSVPLNRKGAARNAVFQALEQFDVGKSEKTVRINAVGSGLEVDDLSVVLRSRHVGALVVPKVQSPKDLEFVSRMIDSIAPEASRANIRVLACIESALGVLNIRDIANADARIDGLIFAAEDFAADTGLVRTPSRTEFLYARQRVATAASAFGLQAIDMVCVDYQNPDVLEEECREGREWGFTGKQAIHPNQLETIQRIFSPSPSDIERATKIVEGYQEHMKKGIGAFNLDGKMIDMPVVKWAERLLAKAKMMNEQSA